MMASVRVLNQIPKEFPKEQKDRFGRQVYWYQYFLVTEKTRKVFIWDSIQFHQPHGGSFVNQ